MTLSAAQQFYLWVVGWPLAGIAAGLLGLRFRPLRHVLTWAPGAYTVAIFVYGLFRGGPNDCSATSASGDFVCHPTSLFSDLPPAGVIVIVAMTMLNLAPLVAARVRARAPSAVAAAVMILLTILFIFGLLFWIPPSSGVLGAAIAGPPDKEKGAPGREPLEADEATKPRPGPV